MCQFRKFTYDPSRIHQKSQKYSKDLGEDVDHIWSKTKLQIKNQLKKKRIERKIQQLSAKEMHGQYLQFNTLIKISRLRGFEIRGWRDLPKLPYAPSKNKLLPPTMWGNTYTSLRTTTLAGSAKLRKKQYTTLFQAAQSLHQPNTSSVTTTCVNTYTCYLQEVTIVPVIIGATGVIRHKGFEDINTKLDIKMNTREAQKIVILSTVNIIRTFFQTNL